MRIRHGPLVIIAAAAVLLQAGPARANGGDGSSALTRPPAMPGNQRSAPVGVDGASSVSATRTFTFFGGGWGHGVGMSQWGSYGLARRGWTHVQMLRHYYTGTIVAPVPPGLPTSIRVGLTWDRTALHLTPQGGPVGLRLGAPAKPPTRSIPMGRTWTITPKGGKFNVFDAAGRRVARVGGPGTSLFATYQRGTQLIIGEAGHTYGRGHIELNVYRACSTCTWRLRAIAVVSRDAYVYGIAEVPSSWPMEAMEAQAIAARTYALYVESTQGLHRPGCNCGVYSSTADQVYSGWDREVGGRAWLVAAGRTAGRVVLYGGSLAATFYFSSSGGYTQNVHDLWGSTVPYLRGVCDPGDYAGPSFLRTWTDRQSASQVGADVGVGVATSIGPAARSANSGRIISITVKGTRGSRVLSGAAFTRDIGLLANKTWVDQDRNVVGLVRGKYDSLMCAPGLPLSTQVGVAGGSGRVQRFARGAIYVNVPLGSTNWLNGPIYSKYLSVNGAPGPLGLPRTGVVTLTMPPGCSGFACTRTVFDHGRIYYKQAVGAHALWGRVIGYYLSHQGALGPLGFPTTDATSNGLRATFEGGTVTCPASGPCHVS
jgi:SpoIID/LytB domain protein